jgi:ribosomal protein S18 acetylase RimI-like enzyme
MEEYVCKITSFDDETGIITYQGILNGIVISQLYAYTKGETAKRGISAEKIVYMNDFKTKEEYRNKGYFGKLLKYALEDLKEKGFQMATLGVNNTRIELIKTYEKYGFDDYYGNSLWKNENGEEEQINYYAKRL